MSKSNLRKPKSFNFGGFNDSCDSSESEDEPKDVNLPKPMINQDSLFFVQLGGKKLMLILKEISLRV